MIDTSKIGVAAARTMEKLDHDISADPDDFDGFEIADVLVVVDMVRPYKPDDGEERHEAYEILESRCVTVCTTERWSILAGMLRMAMSNLNGFEEA